MKAEPAFAINAEDFEKEFDQFAKPTAGHGGSHPDVLNRILAELRPIDFHEKANVPRRQSIPQKVFVVLAIREILRTAQELGCGLARNQGFLYVYNGEYWQVFQQDDLMRFLGDGAGLLGVPDLVAQHYRFKKEMVSQLIYDAYLSRPETDENTVLINLQNGTGVFLNGRFELKKFDSKDFLTHQLPFKYDPDADCPKFHSFLATIMPDQQRQDVLAEFLAYVFARHLKLEKTLFLYGLGANGKSVFCDIAGALFGNANVSTVSLEALCKNEYHRATIANKLLNVSTEISDRLQTDIFKKLSSGEPIEARLPYGQPMMLSHYARLMFNTNELPTDVEITEAFFRRFLIIAFEITIPEERRNPNLAKEIIKLELSGVFNWVLKGLERLMNQVGFSRCESAEQALATFREESDSVAMFLADSGYQRSTSSWISLADLYTKYSEYCRLNGLRAVSSRKVIKRVKILGYETDKVSVGKIIFAEK